MTNSSYSFLILQIGQEQTAVRCQHLQRRYLLLKINKAANGHKRRHHLKAPRNMTGRYYQTLQGDGTQRPKADQLDVEITARDPHFPRSFRQLEHRWREQAMSTIARGGQSGQVQRRISAIRGLLYVSSLVVTPTLILLAREFRKRLGITPSHQATQVPKTLLH